MTSSTKGQPYLVFGERQDKQRTEEQARADREAKKRFADEVATENAMMVNSLFASCFGWNK